MRKCPRCRRDLSESVFDGRLRDQHGRPVTVRMDECRSGCGFWFDRYEVETTVGVRTSLDGDNAGETSIDCVACSGKLHPTKILDVEIDRCDRCGGQWLDAGEVKALAAAIKHGDLRPEPTIRAECSRCGAKDLDAAGMYFAADGLLCPPCWGRAEQHVADETVHEDLWKGTGYGNATPLLWILGQSPRIEDLDE